MTEKLIEFETAKLAKEKGFGLKLDSNYIYNKMGKLRFTILKLHRNDTDYKYLAPTQSLLQRWLREEYNIWIDISINTYPKVNNIAVTLQYFHKDKYISNEYLPNQLEGLTHSYTYEEALEKGLVEALKLI